MIDNIISIFTNSSTKDIYTVAITLIAIYLAFSTMFNKIKCICLIKASEKIADVEQMSDLTGKEKFSLVLSWIISDLPKVFNNAKTQVIVESIIKTIYDNSYKYTSNYIKRKTGYNVSELISKVKKADEDTKNQSLIDDDLK